MIIAYPRAPVCMPSHLINMRAYEVYVRVYACFIHMCDTAATLEPGENVFVFRFVICVP